MSEPTPASASKQPLALLDSQVQLLAELRDIQRAQQQQIEELKRQNETMISLLNAPPQAGLPTRDGLLETKIENFNMPFWSLVGFLIKMSIASIPAALIIAILIGLITALLALLGISIGAIGNTF